VIKKCWVDLIRHSILHFWFCVILHMIIDSVNIQNLFYP
jgi:hypothetical protein